MTTELEKLLGFCVENDLLEKESSERIACEYDRHWGSTKSVVIKCGVDEKKMFETAAKIHHMQLVTLDQITVDKSVLTCVPLNHANQLFCTPYSVTESELSVVTCDWDKLEVVTKGMANLTGKKIHAALITHSDYQRLNQQLKNL